MNRYAVLVGINQYKDNCLEPLKYAHADVYGLARALRRLKFKVATLRGSHARHSRIIRALSKVAESASENDIFLFFFAGHGQLDKEVFVLHPFDTGPDKFIPMEMLSKALLELPCRDCLCILDACRSDEEHFGRGETTVNAITSRNLGSLTRADGDKFIQVLFGCSEGEKCHEDDDLEHGVFTDHLLKVVDSLQTSSRLTFSDLANRVGNLMRLWRSPDDPPKTQQPCLYRPAMRRTVWLHPLDQVVNPLGMEFQFVKGGTFLMGSPVKEIGHRECEGPQGPVTVSDFYMGVHTVTVEQFRRFAMATGRRCSVQAHRLFVRLPKMRPWEEPKTPEKWRRPFEPTSWDEQGLYPHRPIVDVTWEDATAFSEWLSGQAGGKYELPSEAQWEYACRAGSTSPYSFGDELPILNANFGRHIDEPVDVGTFAPNPWGFYEMHGNVGEWCQDLFDPASYAAREANVVDPLNCRQGRRDDLLRYLGVKPSVRRAVESTLLVTLEALEGSHVVRGGSYSDPAEHCRSAYRSCGRFSANWIGFRLVWLPT